jgi:Tol biopolymer transport system component
VHYALSASGALVHLSTAVPSERPAGGGDRDLGWWSPEGTRPASAEIRRFRGAAISPDGRRLAGLSEEGIRSDLWVADVQRGAATRMTHGGFNASPVWSPDGRSVYFSARTSGAFDIWVRDADANLPATRILSAGRHAFPLAASPDGKMLAFARTADGTAADIWLLPLPAGEPRPFVEGPFEERAGSFSPDSRLLAFQSSETGRWEIYVQCVADGRRVLVSTDGGERPIWRSDGLYFQSNGSVIRAAVSDNGRNLTVGPNLPVADIDDDRLRGIAPDGLYLVEGSGSRSRSTAVVTIDWLRKLDTLLGPAQAALPR